MSIIDISPLQTLKFTTEVDGVVSWNQFPASNISPYEWQEGDRVRFITQAGNPDVPGTDLGACGGWLY